MGDNGPSSYLIDHGFSLLEHRISRRRLLALSAMAGAAGLGAACIPPASPDTDQRGRVDGSTHLAWAWQFATDGVPERIVPVLAQNNLGLIMKTHNGTRWMADWDKSPQAVSGPAQVQALASYFESYGVPFHAYCVVNGVDPVQEATMCAQVLGAGARSIFIDLEPWAGYWQGTTQAASIFAQEFHRQQPDGNVMLCVEPRPWVLPRVPMAEFASISKGIAPMVYWETFNTSENIRYFQDYGYPPGNGGITPEFLVDVSSSMFGGYGLPIQPAGQGDSNVDAWVRFLGRAFSQGMGCVSSWRYGVTNPDVWPLLEANPPGSHMSTPVPTPTVKPKFNIGGHAHVANTGSCLNLRDEPSVLANVVGCLEDGTRVTIKDGPVESGGFHWWLVATSTVRGWAADANSFGVPWLVS
jgi:hypothetical protein